jgi:hypothetical protein
MQFASDKLGPNAWKTIKYSLDRVVWATISSIELRKVLGGVVGVSTTL